MEWLFDVHVKLKDLKISWEPRAALLIGNEDCPEEIHLYPRRDPLHTDKALVGRYHCDGDRYIFCGPLDHKTAMEIDKEERDGGDAST
jgi:hypothetical protein